MINRLYESGVSIAERQAAEAVKNGNFRPDTLLPLPPYFWVIFLPISLAPSLRYPLFSGSASCDWSLTKTLSAPWIHISSVFLLISIKRSSHNDTPNGPTSQSRPGGESLLDYWKKQTYYQWAKGCCFALIGVVWRCLPYLAGISSARKLALSWNAVTLRKDALAISKVIVLAYSYCESIFCNHGNVWGLYSNRVAGCNEKGTWK